MQTHSLRRGGKWLALMILAVSMSALGTTYAGWSDALHIRGNLSTAAFDMAADPSGEYRVSLVKPGGRAALELSGVEARTGADGKSVELSFSDGLPASYLREGYSLCLSVPIKNGEGSFMNIRRYEPDFSKERGRVTLSAEGVCLRLDGEVYLAEDGGDELAGALAAFRKPLELAVYPSFEGAPEAMRGTLYLTLTEDSLRQLSALPEELELSAQALELAPRGRPVQVFEPEEAEENGVLVRYRCEVPLAMDQSYKPDTIARVGEGEAA